LNTTEIGIGGNVNKWIQYTFLSVYRWVQYLHTWGWCRRSVHCCWRSIKGWSGLWRQERRILWCHIQRLRTWWVDETFNFHSVIWWGKNQRVQLFV